jgi:CRISPR/Cas system endoribonuclease Cas6 (RAMP superfamily)
MKNITLILNRGDFGDNEHYSHHFDDICDQLGLESNDPTKEIKSIEITITDRSVEYEE